MMIIDVFYYYFYCLEFRIRMNSCVDLILYLFRIYIIAV